jgi:hypothetical protein
VNETGEPEVKGVRDDFEKRFYDDYISGVCQEELVDERRFCESFTNTFK